MEEEHPLWVGDRKVMNHYKRNKPLYDDITDQNIPMRKTVTNYNINANNVAFDRGVINDFNFYDCNIGLQGNLNELA